MIKKCKYCGEINQDKLFKQTMFNKLDLVTWNCCKSCHSKNCSNHNKKIYSDDKVKNKLKIKSAKRWSNQSEHDKTSKVTEDA